MRSDPVFPSLGSTMGGVATHSYVVSEGQPTSSGSMAAPLAYVAFQHPGSAGQPMTVQDEIRTIFITGFPDNVNERELHNLCRFIPGYEASQVSIKPNQQPQVFVLFSTVGHARQALEAIAGLPFDVQQPMMHAVGSKPAGPESAGTAATTSSTSMSTGVLTNQIGSSEGRMVSQTDASGNTKPSAAPAAAPAGDSTASSMNRLQQFVGGSAQSSSGPSPAPQLMHSSNSSLSNAVVGQGMRATVDSQTTGLASSPGGSHMFHTVQLLPPVKYNLRCEMAHKNLYVKDGDPSVRRPHRQIVLLNNPLHMHSVPAGMGSSGAVGHLAPTATGGTTTTMAGASGTSYVHDLTPMYTPSGGAAGVPHTLTVHPLMAAATGPPQSLTLQHTGGVSGVPMGTPLGFLPVTNRGDNPPCNTLFIGNLSDQVSELELLHLLSGQPGYRQMKLVRGPRQVSCFVEFEDTVSATSVHNSYQGAVLASSDRGGIRIQYSKNPFGRRSSNPGSNMAALRSAISMQGSEISSTVSNWPVVTYHTVQQPQRMGQPMGGPQLQGQPTITYY